MKKMILIFAAILWVGQLSAQTDQGRIEQDIKVAESILQTLLNDGQKGVWIGNSVEGNYIEGYGAIFSLPSERIVRGYSRDAYVVTEGDGGSRTVVATAPPPPKPGKGIRYDSDSLQAANRDRLKQVIKTFFLDYGKLMSSLPEDERIMVTEKQGNRFNFVYQVYVGSNSDASVGEMVRNNKLVMEIPRKDIIDYERGRISRDELEKKIIVTENERGAERSADLELLSSIVQRLYSKDLSDTYYITGQPRYDRLQNLGVIYSFRVYSSEIRDGIYFMPTIREDDLEKDERNRKVEELYPAFVEGMKKNMVEYGRTLKSIDQDELLIFRIRLTECIGCNMPEDIELSIKGAVLQDFDARKISLEKAVASVNLKEI